MSEIERAIAYWEEFEREIDEMPHSEILEAQREPVRTALRILRAELDREKNPLTWNERINQMTVKEKARLFEKYFCASRIDVWEDFLNSPYAEGEKE